MPKLSSCSQASIDNPSMENLECKTLAFSQKQQTLENTVQRATVKSAPADENLDNSVAVHQTLQDEIIDNPSMDYFECKTLPLSLHQTHHDTTDSEEDDSSCDTEEVHKVTFAEAMEAMETLKTFLIQQAWYTYHLTQNLMPIEAEIRQHESPQQQKTPETIPSKRQVQNSESAVGTQDFKSMRQSTLEKFL